MKKYAWIKQESDAETYLINKTYYKVVWSYSTGNDTGPHNQFDTDVCIFKWVGEPCTLDELPKVFGNDWEPVEGFDLETIENSYGNLEVDWKDYAKKVDEILAQIEEEETEMTKAEIINIIDSRLDLLNTLIAENTDFNLSYTLAYARAELEQLKIIIKYKEETI